MLRMQDDLNGVLDPNWQYKFFNNRLAAAMETAELIDHYPWKWWKAGGETNIGQARMELVDVWHFLLSEIILSDDDLCRGALDHSDISPDEEYGDVKASGLALMGALAHGTVLSICHHFHWLRADVGMSWQDLYKLYMGKNLLNKLRWSTGYGTSYIKTWFGEEDNIHLTRILEGVDADDPQFSLKVQDALACKYREVVEDAVAS